MKTTEEGIAAGMERIRLETDSDFAGLGLIDTNIRKLRWSHALGSISKRTLLVEQKPSAGISGAAIRSGRPASTSAAMTDAERFKLGEPILLAEQLRIAVSVPIETSEGITGVILLGRRSLQAYRAEELECATMLTKKLAEEIG